MIEKLSKRECCGCGACYNVCPYDAIEMRYDDFGCSFPYVDSDKCRDCGACMKVCNYAFKENISCDNIEVYAIADKNSSRRIQSASGGAFAILASQVIEDAGIVYGCAFDSQGLLEPRHIRITSLEELPKIQGSKYVQSNLGKIYQQVKDDLNNKRFVLFSGTPCQIDGLYGFLCNRGYNNLLTVDIICHGVPGTNFFRSYLECLEEQYGAKIVNMKFRDKSISPWNKLRGSFSIKQGKKEKKIVLSPILSSYYSMFLNGHIFRDSCYTCKYANSSRISDITIGDYWGVEKQEAAWIKKNKIDIKKGISCLLVNTCKGKIFFEKIDNKILATKTNIEKVSLENQQLLKPSSNSMKRDIIKQCYIKDGYRGVEKLHKETLGKKYFLYVLWEKIKI